MNFIERMLLMLYHSTERQNHIEEIRAFLEIPFEEMQKHKSYNGLLDHSSLVEAGLYKEIRRHTLEIISKSSIANMAYLSEHAESQADREQAHKVYFQILTHYIK